MIMKGMIKVLIWIISFAFASTVLAQTQQMTSTFTKEQKNQIKEIIHRYLTKNPEVLIEMSSILQERKMQKQQKEIAQEVKKNINRVLDSDHMPVMGNPKGDITLVEFFDYQCAHCKHLSPVISKLLKKDKHLRVIFREFPVLGSSSLLMTKAALAAHLQNKYFIIHRLFMISSTTFNDERIINLAKKLKLDVNKFKEDKEGKSVEQMIENNYELAKTLHIGSTPVVIITKTKVSEQQKMDPPVSVQIGFTSQETLQTKIAEIRKSGH